MGIEDDVKKLAELITKRSSIKGQITKFKNYVDRFDKLETLTTTERAELTLKLSRFEALSSKFDDLQSNIEVINYNKLDEELAEREIIERDFISNIVAAQTLLQVQSHVDSDHESSNYHNVSHCGLDHNETGIRLPLINIAKFDGSHLKWMEFRDTFKSLVHENSRISPVNKFHYLLSYLEGEPARTVANLEVSSNNYAEAWSLLLQRYDNKRLLIDHHLSSLFNITALQKESEKSLRFLVDHVTKNLRALSNLGQATEHWDVIVIHLVSSKLDSNTFMRWEEHRNTMSTDTPTLKDFHKFLNDRASILESVHRSRAESSSKSHGQQRAATATNAKPERSHWKSYACTSNSNTNSDQQQRQSPSNLCACCNSTEHKIFDCPSFKAMSVSDRITKTTKLKLYKNCLKPGHFSRQCRFGPCRECKKRHNSLLHLTTNIEGNTTSAVSNISPVDTLANFCNENISQVLLSTALIEAVNPRTRKSVAVRALLDCGSQTSFLTLNLKGKLSLDVTPLSSTNVIGFGNNYSGTITECCAVQIKSFNTSFNVTSNFYVMNQLTSSLPNSSFDISSLKIPSNIILADPKFYEPSQVDMLIGSDLFWDIIGSEQQSLGPGCPRLHSSKLGWLIGGPVPLYSKETNNNVKCNTVFTNFAQGDDDPYIKMSRFWEIEEIPSKVHLNDSEQACERHFVQHTRRLSNGRFCVRLPLFKSPDCLGDSHTMAKKRFYNLEKRFKRQPEVKSQYIAFIREYAELGHLSEVTLDSPTLNLCYHLPHHPVFKENSESTKIRVVFDASARTSSGVSVNDIQMVGPQIQDSLFSILVRARLYKYILTADIEKMYRQVVIDESDRNLQLILWREDEREPLKTLRLNTITYGFASASYLSTRCLWQLGEECEDPLTKTILQHDLYVDDLITGCNDEYELKCIQQSVSEALKAGCFNLRKYKSNSLLVLQSCSSSSSDKLVLSESASALGLGKVLCDLPVIIELHSFSDASQRAYGACIFIKSVDAANNNAGFTGVTLASSLLGCTLALENLKHLWPTESQRCWS
ncbi:uncharacterized protein LOC125077958 [Vanessa atalanta]|uniref:uncharacterized protein LOC125077958 n=1 Tax=Vanessa atalanta TaxID=42275 RepID=UPI001FCD3594|nr:uncharacterized protein LOC125077958 [Vanessa atalanta]